MGILSRRSIRARCSPKPAPTSVRDLIKVSRKHRKPRSEYNNQDKKDFPKNHRGGSGLSDFDKFVKMGGKGAPISDFPLINHAAQFKARTERKSSGLSFKEAVEVSKIRKLLEVGRLDFDSKAILLVKAMVLTTRMGEIGKLPVFPRNNSRVSWKDNTEGDCGKSENVPSPIHVGSGDSFVRHVGPKENLNSSPCTSGLPPSPPYELFQTHYSPNVDFVKATPDLSPRPVEGAVNPVDARPIPDLNDTPILDGLKLKRVVSLLEDDQINSVINCLTAKSTWDDLILYHEGPSDVKESRVMDLKLCYHTFKFKEDSQDSLDDEEDTRSSQEYMNDLEEEYQARALLAKSKRFFKKGTQRFSSAKETDQTECNKYAKKGKNKGLIVESYNWDEEEVSSDDNEVPEVKALMDFADEERVSVSKKSARNGE
ncbi:hypothetical protein Tco_1081237 [Tanacetum coccineum]|uniref:Uncharacterized protein n=1 Tax=Tanacetum coccineum TaxID=301880 RepID=A0ABQ5HZ46_9ASTR